MGVVSLLPSVGCRKLISLTGILPYIVLYIYECGTLYLRLGYSQSRALKRWVEDLFMQTCVETIDFDRSLEE